jgi:xylulokinase
MEVAYIGVDAGTSACKAVAVGAGRRVLHSAWRPYATAHAEDGAATQDALDWRRALAETMRECVEVVGARAIGGVGVTAPAHNVVLVGDNGEPLAPVILWSDSRSADVARRLADTLGQDYADRSLVSLGPGWTLAQLAWLHGRSPELWRRLQVVLPGKDYLRWLLTGVAATDPSDAAGTALFDQRARCWIPEALAAAHLAEEQLPRVLPADATAGGVCASWASLTGLLAGTPVAVGATDTAAELVAVDATEPGSALVKFASTGTVVTVSAEPRPHPRLLTYPHAVANRWYTLAATNSAATAYTWLRDALFEVEDGGPERLYARMDRVASATGPGAEGLLFMPYLSGERSPHWDPDLRAAFLGLSAIHGRSHLCRAVLEGVALSLRSCRDLLHDAGLPTGTPLLGGGGMASSVWREIVVATLGQPATMPRPQGPAIGAAMLAAAAAGDRDTLERASADSLRVAVRDDWRHTYDALYDVYGRAHGAIAGISHDLVRPRSSAPRPTVAPT